MPPRPQPTPNPKQHWSRLSDPVDAKNNQEQNHRPLLSRAGVNLKRGIRRVKGSVDGKPKPIEDNENRETSTLDGKETKDTRALDGEEIKDVNGEEVRETREPDRKEDKDKRTLDGMELAPHDPEGTDWKKDYENAAKELKHLQDDFKHLEDEHYDHQQGIRERARTLELEFEDPLHSLLPAEHDFDFAIKTLLDHYELRIKERERLNRRYQSEHKRCIEKDDALKDKDSHFRMLWDSQEITLRTQFGQERANAYNEGRADEHSSWTVSWNKYQSEHQDTSLQLKEEQAKRRLLETKVEFLETEAATAQCELSAAVHKVTQEHNRTLGALKNLENANLRLVGESSLLEEKHRSQIEVSLSNLKIEHVSEIRTIEEAHEKEMEQLEKEHEDELGNMNGKAETLKKNHIAEIDRREKHYAQEISNLKAKTVSLQEAHTKALESKGRNHSSELSKAQDKIIGLKKEHAMELETKGKAHIGGMSKLEGKMKSLEENHAIELRTRSITYAAELKARDQIHAEEELKMKGKMESLKVDHCAVLKSRDDTHAAATSKLKKQFRDHLAQREKEHTDITKALRATVADYSGALLERDKITYNMIEGKPFEPLLDAEVEARFVGLAGEVDTLSRLDWKANPSGWPEEVLVRLSRNQKTLKRQILKDTIWVILHEFVFCSPFRVFGDEGRALESKWNEECGADDASNNGSYVWPKPSMKTERWRYITIRECRAALQKPIPSPYDSLAKPRKGFQDSIKTIKEELTTAVGGLVSLNQTNIQDLEKMAMRAARTWLEFGLQRYRVMVQMQGDKMKSVEEKVERLDNGLALVVAPRLERFGNAKGEDLDEKESIGELAGEIVTLKL